jgi:CoA:oxalate CoA-transferase
MDKILEDVRILDFTHVWFGPYCTMMLGELGAEVIMVEPPWGNIGRLGPGELYKGTATTFWALNQNKRNVAVDLKNPEAMKLVKELVKKSDVVVQNFAPGAMERLGLGYDVLKELNPRVIYAALSGFGQTGPYSRYGSYAVVAEAISGHTYATGKGISPDHPPVTMAGALGDLGPAMYAAFAIVAALRHRDRTGVGQMIDVAQIDTMVAFNCCSSVAYDMFKESPIERRKNRPQDPNRIWGVFQVKDGWVQIAGERGKAIENLKQELGVDEVSKEMVVERIKDKTRYEAFQWLANLGFPCAPIYEAHEAMWDPHLKARDMWVEVDSPVAGRFTVPNFPVKFSETPGEVDRASPAIGMHTREVLKGLLGKSDADLNALEKAGAIAQWKG